MYDIHIDSVEPLQRQYGKLAILACGFQGAHKALTRFAANYGLVIERKEAGRVVKAFRDARPKLVASWGAFDDAAQLAIAHPGEQFRVKDCQRAIFQMQGEHLTLELPSGRKIWYPYARVEEIVVTYEDLETGKMKKFKTY